MAWIVLARFLRLTELSIYFVNTHGWPCINSGGRGALRGVFADVTTLNLDCFGYVGDVPFFLAALPDVTRSSYMTRPWPYLRPQIVPSRAFRVLESCQGP